MIDSWIFAGKTIGASKNIVSGFSSDAVIATLALVISIVTLILEILRNSKNNKLAAEAEIFKEIFHEHLIKGVPESRKKILYNQGKISGTDDLIEELNLIRQDSLYYKYKDKIYYKKLKSKLQDLENKLVESDSMDQEDYNELYEEINIEIENIYSIIMQKQIGNNRYHSFFLTRDKKSVAIVILVIAVIILFLFK